MFDFNLFWVWMLVQISKIAILKRLCIFALPNKGLIFNRLNKGIQDGIRM
jgi:hypothetical protein